MAKMKLTERTLARIKAPTSSGNQELTWDTELRGFGVLASGTSNIRSFVVQRPVRGKKRRRAFADVNTVSLADARTKAGELLFQMRQGIDPNAIKARGMPTLKEALESYIAVKGDKLRPKSVAGYRQVVTQHFKDWHDLELTAVTAEMVEKKHTAIGKASGKAMANLAMRSFRAIYNSISARKPDMPHHPVRILGQQRGWFKVERRKTMVPLQDLPKFYQAVCRLESAVARDYLLLLLFTGMRREEAASLTWEDIDLTAKIIRVPATRTKAGRPLDLPMSTFVHDMLVARRNIGNGKWVFPSNGKGGYLAEPKYPLGLVAEDCGVAVSAHDLRRTFSTVAEHHASVRPMALKALLNHSVGNDVTTGYVITTTEDLRESAQKVCDKLIELCGIEVPRGRNVRRIR
jgi:integrase